MYAGKYFVKDLTLFVAKLTVLASRIVMHSGEVADCVSHDAVCYI